MSEERGSLADEAAAWVPPWLRDRPAEPSAESAEPSAESGVGPDSSPAEPAASTEAPEGTAEPAPPADPEPVTVVPRQPVFAPPAEPLPKAEPVDAAVDGVVPLAEPEPVVEPAPVEDPVAAGDVPETRPRPEAAAAPAEAPVLDKSAWPGRMLALIDDDELRGALEAILLVVDQPVTAAVLASALEQPAERVTAMLERLADEYTATGRGFELRRAAGGWRLYTRPEYAAYVERFVLDGQSVRLTQAALETLAVVAYKQPVTRSRISAIRGVNCDGVVRTLVSRGLIEECGTEPETGAYLYQTTTLFLEKLGLDRVEQLPPLAPFLPDNVEEIADAPR